MTDSRVIVALDFSRADAAMALVERLTPRACRVKVGKELFTAAGPALIERIQRAGFEIFLDLKFHDIPNTVAGACKAAAGLGVWMLNVHASGARAMLEAARSAVVPFARPPLLIAVTLLTSMGARELGEVGIQGQPDDVVLRLASLARACGLDGVVCSAQEAAALRERNDNAFLLVTPGIRPGGAAADDQQRVMTPRDAILAGVNYLVVGRPITRAADPQAALAAINDEVAAALAESAQRHLPLPDARAERQHGR
jgi:orotidine-5'-phosphate decarboxylase